MDIISIKKKVEKTFMELEAPHPSWKIPLKISIFYFYYLP